MNFNDGFSRRVAMARNSLGLTQAELAKKVGVVTRQIAAYEGNEAKPREKVLTNLAAVLGTTNQWLMTGEGKSPNISNVKQTVTVTEIPVISLADAYQFLYSQDDSYINCISGLIPAPLLASESAFAIEVQGDGMRSAYGVNIIEGSLVTFDPDREVSHGDLVLINKKGDNDIFFVQALRENHSWIYQYLNPIYQKPVNKGDEITVLAVAIHYQYDLRDGDHHHWFFTPKLPKIVSEIPPDYVAAQGGSLLPNNHELVARLDKIESMLEQLLNKK
ncbi:MULTISPECIES: LexA family protein [Providencia]|uniref:LexA family protein n=1 Tax=Providencia TaxID=586 RepID=UPI00234A43A9|nr:MULTISPECIES: helix-turn-helix domain-containing protein [unclassified Providencia]